MDRKNLRIAVRITYGMRKKIEERAKNAQCNISDIIRAALWRYFYDREQKQKK